MKNDTFDNEHDPFDDDEHESDVIPEEDLLFDEVFEEEEEREPTRFDHVKPYLMAAIAFVAVLGLLNLSGFYQVFRFFETPSGVLEEAVEPPVDLERITVPLVFYVVRGSNGSERTDADIDQLMRNGQRIWDQAQIGLERTAVHEITLTEADAELLFEDPSAFSELLQAHEDQSIAVVLVRSLRGINGVAYPGLRTISVADLTTIFDFRVFAHEIGHALSLSHIDDRDLLMHKEANSIRLTEQEIESAREAAKAFTHAEID